MIDQGTLAIPEPTDDVAPMTLAEVDEVVATVADQRKAWVETGLDERIALLDRVRRSAHEVAERWAEAEADAKAIPPSSPLRGETWIGGPMIVLPHPSRWHRAARSAPPAGGARRG